MLHCLRFWVILTIKVQCRNFSGLIIRWLFAPWAGSENYVPTGLLTIFIFHFVATKIKLVVDKDLTRRFHTIFSSFCQLIMSLYRKQNQSIWVKITMVLGRLQSQSKLSVIGIWGRPTSIMLWALLCKIWVWVIIKNFRDWALKAQKVEFLKAYIWESDWLSQICHDWENYFWVSVSSSAK